MNKYLLIPIFTGGVLVTAFIKLFLDNTIIAYFSGMIFGCLIFYLFNIGFFKLIVKWSKYPSNKKQHESLTKAYSYAFLPLLLFGISVIFFIVNTSENILINSAIVAFCFSFIIFTLFIHYIKELERRVKLKVLLISFTLLMLLFSSPIFLYIGMWIMLSLRF